MTSSRRTPTDAEALATVLAERAAEEEAARLGEEPGGGAGGGEPGEEKLLDYLEGRLPPEAEAALQRRLVASPEAARKLLDLEDLLQARARSSSGAGAGTGTGGEAGSRSGEGPADFAVRAGWRDLQGRLPGREGAWRRWPPLLSAVAAALALAVVGLGAWVWQLESEREPSFLVATVESLELGAASRSGEGEAVELEPGGFLRLVLLPEERCPEYRAEVTGPLAGASPGEAEARTHALSGLERDELGLVTPLLLDPAPGRYTVLLLGCEPEREISRHGFEIVRPGDAILE
ncbi:MAG TPA: hypothetical protein VM599_09600 [Thermoanaerobaculia bacterium]|nr:hypothetical protein [Thermoanaerobaculia bacterium]